MITVWEVLIMSFALGALTFLVYEFFSFDVGEPNHSGAVKFALMVFAGTFCFLAATAGMVTLLEAA